MAGAGAFADLVPDDDAAAKRALPLIDKLERSDAAAQQQGVPVDQVRSPAGAMGRYQVMPSTGALYGFGDADLTDPGTNSQAAERVLADAAGQYGRDPALMAAAYNGGPRRATAIQQGRLSEIPKETQDYYGRALTLIANGAGAVGDAIIPGAKAAEADPFADLVPGKKAPPADAFADLVPTAKPTAPLASMVPQTGLDQAGIDQAGKSADGIAAYVKNLFAADKPLPRPGEAQGTWLDTILKAGENVPAALEKTAGGIVRHMGEAAPEPAIGATMGDQEREDLVHGGPQIDANLARNTPYIKPGATNFQTKLAPADEAAFQKYIADKSDKTDLGRQDDPTYDLRGWWKAAQAGDPRAATRLAEDGLLHRSDYWKTPLHPSFSAESQWATPDAPRWQGNKLVDKAGNVVHDDAAPEQPTSMSMLDAARQQSGLTTAGKNMAAAAEKHLKDNAPNIPANSAKQYAYDIANGLPTMLALMGASAATKSPVPVLAGFGLQGYGDKYAESRAAGRSPEQADADATFSAAAMALPAMLPVHAIMKPGQKFLGKLLSTTAAGTVQMELTTALQLGYDKGTITPDMTWGEARDALVHSGIVGTGFGLALGAGGGAVGRIAAMRKAGVETAPPGPGEPPAPPPEIQGRKGKPKPKPPEPQYFPDGDSRNGPAAVDVTPPAGDQPAAAPPIWSHVEPAAPAPPRKGPKDLSGLFPQTPFAKPADAAPMPDLQGQVEQAFLARMAKANPADGRWSASNPASQKTSAMVADAISTGQYNDALHPQNKNARATFEDLTGTKLPKGVKATQDVFKGEPFQVAPGFRTSAGAIRAEHDADVSSLEAEGTKAAMPKNAAKPAENAAGSDGIGQELTDSAAKPAKPGIFARVKAKLTGSKAPAAPAYDFETTFPEPQDEELRRAGRPGFWDEAGTGEKDPEALRAFHEESQNQVGDTVARMAEANKAIETGLDPRTGKPPKPKEAASFKDKWINEAAMARRDFEDHLGSYQDYFGDKATKAFRQHVLDTFDETGAMAGEAARPTGGTVTPDEAKAALASNIDPATGQKPKGNAALRAFRAAMEKIATSRQDVFRETTDERKNLQGVKSEPTDEGQRQGIRQGVSEAGDTGSAAVPVRRSGGNAPRRLQQASGGDLAVPETPSGVASVKGRRAGKAAVTAAGATSDAAPVLKNRLRGVVRAIPKDSDHVAAILSRAGGIRDNEGHDLVKGRGLQQMIPGAGPLIRPKGMSIDAAGEVLWNEGFWGNPDHTPRPTEDQVLQLLERTGRGPDGKPKKVYKPERQQQVDATRQDERDQEQADSALEDIHKAAKGAGAKLTDDQARQILEEMGAADIDAESAVVEHLERLAKQVVHEDHEETGNYPEAEAIPFDPAEGETYHGAGPGEQGQDVPAEEAGRAAAPGEPDAPDSGEENRPLKTEDGDAVDGQGNIVPQTVAPGTERLTDAEMKRRDLEKKLAGKKQGKPGQKTTHGFGLFDPEAALAPEENTGDMFDLPKEQFEDKLESIVDVRKREAAEKAASGETEPAPPAHEPAPKKKPLAEIAQERRERFDAMAGVVKDTFDRTGRVSATRNASPDLSIGLTRGTGEAPFRVTSFEKGEPTGHRDYNSIEEAATEFYNTNFDPRPTVKGDAAAEKPSNYGKSNTVFTEDAAAKARETLKALRNKMQSGIDPEVVQAGITLAGYHIEAGARAFGDYAKAMLADLGEHVRPYLKMWYNAVRDYPGFDAKDMTPHDQITAEAVAKAGTDVLDSSTSPEPDRQERDAEIPDSEAAVSPGPGEAERGAGDRGKEAGEEGDGPESGAGAADGGPDAVGEHGGSSVRAEKQDLFGDHAGSGGDQRGGNSGDQRVRSDHVPASTVTDAARDASHLKGTIDPEKHVDAESVDAPAVPRDIANALPTLFPEQQADVAFAEQRFAEPDGHGVMFTNGTGTGKTFTGGGIIKRMVDAGKKNVLVVAPTQGILNHWKEAAEKLGIPFSVLDSTATAGKGVVGTTYANLGQNRTLADRDWHSVIADEAHTLMSQADGNETAALAHFRAITNHPDRLQARARMQMRAEDDELTAMGAKLKALKKARDPKADALEDEYSAKYHAFELKVRDKAAEFKAQPRAKAVFLSATPFAYDKNVDYANGYLFDYGPEPQGGGYNQPSAKDAFFMRHFGYRMRYGKLTKPEAAVESDIMERGFHEWMRKQGVLSGRVLNVDKDYDRKFILTNNAVGAKIDQALDWLGKNRDDRNSGDLADAIRKRFDYLSRMRLLEAIKAKDAIKIIRQHHALGRKVVVFHDYNEGGGFSPFRADGLFDPQNKDMMAAYLRFEAANPYIKDIDAELSTLGAPLVTLKKAFPDALIYNGTVPTKLREQAKVLFNRDAGPSGQHSNLIIVQSAAGQAGISLHDTTGKHSRVTINLGMPGRPTTAIQEEGRTYRIGQASDATFRYMNTGSNWERFTFASRLAERAGTAENLALGDLARTLRQSFIDAFNDSDTFPPSKEDGRGGKAADRALAKATTDFQRAKTFYFAQQKTSGNRNSRLGKDYYATPEPLGQKMVEWANIRPGDRVLEPSAGHGAIARFFPETADRHLVEPSTELASRAALASPGANVLNHTFEDLHKTNKYDAIVMNPPFGMGGAQAVAHLAKAAGHLRDGGRIVALIPQGGAADARFEKFMESDEAKGLYIANNIKLPPSTFERAGTKVNTRVVILDKQMDPDRAQRIQQSDRDFSDAEDIGKFFDRIEHSSVKDRIALPPPPVEQQAAAAALLGGRDGKLPAAPRPGAKATAPPGEPVAFTTHDLKHTKTGAPVFVAALRDRVDRDAYSAANSLAKQFGGYYSSYKGAGAVPGFLFKTAEARQSFMDAHNERNQPNFARRQDDSSDFSAADETKRAGAVAPDGKTTQALLKESTDKDQILDHIAKYSADPERKRLARVLKQTIADNISYRPMRNSEARNPDTGNYRGGFYDHQRQLFTVHPELADDPERAFLHEGVHAATVSAIYSNTPAGKQINRLFDAYQALSGKYQWKDYGDQYGFRNSKEFIAEALTKPRFREVLDGIKADGQHEKSLLQKLGDILRRLFRLKPSDPLGYIYANEAAVFDPKTILGGAARETLQIRDGKTKRAYEPKFGQDDAQAFHGTPHEFDKFDTDAIGTGEGNKTYGWGLYFAGEKKTAEYYRERLAPWHKQINAAIEKLGMSEAATKAVQSRANSSMYEFQSAREGTDRYREYGPERIAKRTAFQHSDVRAEVFKNEARITEALRPAMTKRPGKMFQVDIKPKDADFLNLDRTVADQSPQVRAALEKVRQQLEAADELGNYEEHKNADFSEWTGHEIVRQIVPRMAVDDLIPHDDGEITKALEDGDDAKAASLYLKSLGIPGNKYADAHSRGEAKVRMVQVDGKTKYEVNPGILAPNKVRTFDTRAEALDHADSLGTHNYVLFDADHVQVEAQFSKPKGWGEAGGETPGQPTADARAKARGRVVAHIGAVKPEFAAAAEELAKTARKRLDQVGLHDTALEVAQWIKAAGENQKPEFWDSVDGVHYPMQNLIRMALESKLPHAEALDHESVHAMRRVGLINDADWAILEKKAATWLKLDKYKHIPQTYAGSSKAKILEEAIAHAYPDHVAGRLGQDGNAVKRIFRKISNFFEAVRNAFAGHGFKSAHDVFTAMDKGDLAPRREPRASDGEPQFSRVPNAANDEEVGEIYNNMRALVAEFIDNHGANGAELAPGMMGIAREMQTFLEDTGADTFGHAANKRKWSDLLQGFKDAQKRFNANIGKSTVTPIGQADFARRSPDPVEPEPEDKRTPINRAVAKFDHIVGEGAAKVGKAINDAAAKLFPDSAKSVADSVQMALTPMATGTPEARATAKDFANTMRKARVITGRQIEYLEKNFQPDQLAKMWEAADEESVLRQQQAEPGPTEGLNRLTPTERAAVEAYQAESDTLLRQAKDIGLFKGEGLPSYVPRMVVAMGADGRYGRLQGAGSDVPHGLDAVGKNLKTTSPNLRQRKHLTAQETEEAAKGIDAGAVVVKDFRTLPMAMGRLQEAIAGRTLIDNIRRIGADSGELTVSDGAQPNTNEHGPWFTMDHPAFKTFRPKFVTNPDTGKTEVLETEHGDPIFERVPLYVRGDFKGPLLAVLSKKSGPIYNGAIAIKGKSMSIIMYSPLMHNAVIWGKAFPAAPLKLMNPLWRGADGKWHMSIELYGRGRAAKNDQSVMKRALDDGLDPIGHRYFNQDASAIMEEPNLKPGRSWTAQLAGFIPGLFDKAAGDAVKRRIDQAGDIWHNKLLWDLVGDLQMGLYTHMRDSAIKLGHDERTAGRYAAHYANRYGGALPIESMSRMARMTANIALFSRSFTLTNLGAYKDLVRGLPKDVQAQIERDAGPKALRDIQGTARRKGASLLLFDIGLSLAGLALAQHAMAWMMGIAYHSPDENEPGRNHRFLIGYQQDGTAVYGRLPTGKVGEELQDWATQPNDLAHRKMSPFAQTVNGLWTNDRGFGRKIYDPYDPSMATKIQNIGRIAKFMAGNFIPTGAFDAMIDQAKGKGDSRTNWLKILAPMAGVTISKGAPGGPAVGQLYASKDEHEFQVGEAMPDIREAIAADDLAKAEKQMSDLGMSPSYQKFVIRTTKHPGSRLSAKAMRDFMGYATPGEKARMKAYQDEAKDNGDDQSALEPGDLGRALKAGTLERFAASGATWSRKDAVRAASAAGMPAMAALLREAREPFRADLREKLLGETGTG